MQNKITPYISLGIAASTLFGCSHPATKDDKTPLQKEMAPHEQVVIRPSYDSLSPAERKKVDQIYDVIKPKIQYTPNDQYVHDLAICWKNVPLSFIKKAAKQIFISPGKIILWNKHLSVDGKKTMKEMGYTNPISLQYFQTKQIHSDAIQLAEKYPKVEKEFNDPQERILLYSWLQSRYGQATLNVKYPTAPAWTEYTSKEALQ